jgi:integrase/recombinase XerD
MDESLDSYLEYSALEKKLASLTIKAYSNDLRSFNLWLKEGGVVLSEAAASDIAEYMAFLSSTGYSPVSIVRKLSSIRGFFRFIQSSGQRSDNPVELLHSPRQPARLPHAVSVETTRIFLEEALVRPVGKGSRERLVPLGGAAVRWLSLYIDTARPLLVRGKSTPVLFLTYRGNPLSRMTVWNIVRRSAEMAGIKERIHPHILRHSFATHLLRGGADLRVVQELLGHADIKTTEIYTSVDTTYLRGVVDRYHPRSVVT